MGNQLHEIPYEKEYIHIMNTSYLPLLKLERMKCCINWVETAYTGMILSCPNHLVVILLQKRVIDDG